MITAEDAIGIYQRLLDYHIQVWLIGGWGIDALLHEHTRSHKDLDVLMLVDDVGRMCELLGQEEYKFGYLWGNYSGIRLADHESGANKRIQASAKPKTCVRQAPIRLFVKNSWSAYTPE